MTISNEPLDEVLNGCKRPEDLLGDADLMKALRLKPGCPASAGQLTQRCVGQVVEGLGRRTAFSLPLERAGGF